MHFSGKKEVSLRGASSKEMSKEALLTKVAEERRQRTHAKQLTTAVITLQRIVRGRRAAAHTARRLEGQWDSRFRTQQPVPEAGGGGAPPMTAEAISYQLLRPLLFVLMPVNQRRGDRRAGASILAAWRSVDASMGERVAMALGVMLASLDHPDPRFNYASLATSQTATWHFQTARLVTLCSSILGGGFNPPPASQSAPQPSPPSSHPSTPPPSSSQPGSATSAGSVSAKATSAGAMSAKAMSAGAIHLPLAGLAARLLVSLTDSKYYKSYSRPAGRNAATAPPPSATSAVPNATSAAPEATSKPADSSSTPPGTTSPSPSAASSPSTSAPPGITDKAKAVTDPAVAKGAADLILGNIMEGQGGFHVALRRFILSVCPPIDTGQSGGDQPGVESGILLILAAAFTVALRPLKEQKQAGGSEPAWDPRTVTKATAALVAHLFTIPFLPARLPPLLLFSLRHPAVLCPCLRLLNAPLRTVMESVPGADLAPLADSPEYVPLPPSVWALATLVALATLSPTKRTELSNGKGFTKGAPLADYCRALSLLLYEFRYWMNTMADSIAEKNPRRGRLQQQQQQQQQEHNEGENEAEPQLPSESLLAGPPRPAWREAVRDESGPGSGGDINPRLGEVLSPLWQPWHSAAIESAVSGSAGAAGADVGGPGSKRANEGGVGICGSADGEGGSANPLEMGDWAKLYAGLLVVLLELNESRGGGMPVLNVLAFTPKLLTWLWAWLREALAVGDRFGTLLGMEVRGELAAVESFRRDSEAWTRRQSLQSVGSQTLERSTSGQSVDTSEQVTPHHLRSSSSASSSSASTASWWSGLSTPKGFLTGMRGLSTSGGGSGKLWTALGSFGGSQDGSEGLQPTVVGGGEGSKNEAKRNVGVKQGLWGAGVGDLARDVALILSVFSASYRHLLLILGDDEFYEKQEPFRLEQQREIAATLNTLVFSTLSRPPPSSYVAPLDAQDDLLLLTHCCRCLQAIYQRDCRRPFCPPELWRAPDLEGEGAGALLSTPALARAHLAASEGPASGAAGGGSTLKKMPNGIARQLALVPHVLPFDTRVRIFRELVAGDKARLGIVASAPPSVDLVVMRAALVESAFRAFSGLGTRLKRRIHVTFVNEHGLQEAGLDHGGLSKELLTEVSLAAFDPRRGLFMQTDTADRQLYPNHMTASLDLPMMEFCGRLVGKALYEGILLDLNFAPLFVCKLLGRSAFLDELAALDKELHRNLLYLKHYEGDARDLSLDFTITEEMFGERYVRELRPGGASIPVTNDNKLQYIHAVANYKLNIQSRPAVRAFLNGLNDLIAPSWLRLFSESEFNQLLSGGKSDIDLEDLQANTVYSGGYSSSSRTIRLFWEVMASLNAEERCALLKFVTSCSRGPLLGFKHLHPPFTIHKVDCATSVFAPIGGKDAERLPSASTCYNMLKLPTYKRASTMREKIKYAIKAGVGFELS